MPDVALVTGGTGAIGRCICDRLAADGWHVVAADLAPPDDAGAHAFQPLDVRSTDAVDAALKAAAELGPLRAVVNSHGVIRYTDPTSASDEDMRLIMDVNLEGVARVCRAASQYLADGGAIVSLSSIVARIGRANGAFVYSATKAGVESLTRSFAVALGPRGIRVNAVAPGFVSQPMAGDGQLMRDAQGGDEPLIQASPMGRLVTPAEIASAVAFLCSSAASGVSGAVLPVDTAQAAL